MISLSSGMLPLHLNAESINGDGDMFGRNKIRNPAVAAAVSSQHYRGGLDAHRRGEQSGKRKLAVWRRRAH
jgi:hypothetical protein